MNDSGSLKIDQATKHIDSLNELFRKQRPFSYILETNTDTRERATFAKQDKAIIDRAALICGDAIHNLRTALDHAYWEIVSPVARNDAERKTIQFPFRETEARLKKAVEEGFPQRVSPAFCKVLLDLKPHGEAGGNKFLYFLYAVDILDKHKLLIPAANYADLSSKMMRQQIPDWPPHSRRHWDWWWVPSRCRMELQPNSPGIGSRRPSLASHISARIEGAR